MGRWVRARARPSEMSASEVDLVGGCQRRALTLPRCNVPLMRWRRWGLDRARSGLQGSVLDALRAYSHEPEPRPRTPRANPAQSSVNFRRGHILIAWETAVADAAVARARQLGPDRPAGACGRWRFGVQDCHRGGA